MKKQEQPLQPLSASKVKTLENCSWLYWCAYCLKLPQQSTDGAKKGDICHTIFELILSKNRQEQYNRICRSGTIIACPPVARLVRRLIKKNQIHDTNESFNQIDKMILVGLLSDFFVKGGELIAPEYKFDFVNKALNFRIKGYIDKLYIRRGEIIIDDFKSSKRKFAGEDFESNLQALFYSYATSQIWPKLSPRVRFIFLQYPTNPLMELKFSEGALLGFEQYLSAIQARVEGFNECVAHGNFACDQSFSPNEFKGKLLCGFAKHAGQLKKDGTKMWHCPFRFPFDYYALIDKKGQTIRTAFSEEELGKPVPEFRIEERHYDGCPKYSNPLDKIDTPIQSLNNDNVLDDF